MKDNINAAKEYFSRIGFGKEEVQGHGDIIITDCDGEGCSDFTDPEAAAEYRQYIGAKKRRIKAQARTIYAMEHAVEEMADE